MVYFYEEGVISYLVYMIYHTFPLEFEAYFSNILQGFLEEGRGGYNGEEGFLISGIEAQSHAQIGW